MFRGFYGAASGMLAQQRRTEMLTNNMSNANTPGFKAEESSMRAFPEMLLTHFDKQTIPTQKGLTLPFNNQIGSLNTGVYMQEAIPAFTQGDLRETTIRTDIALQDLNMPINEANGKRGSIFYTVQNENGDIRFTRNGKFTLDFEGYLTTGSGLYVLDEGGERIQLSNDNFQVNETGYITDQDETVYRLGIQYAENPYRLVKEGDGIFREENPGDLIPAYNLEDVRFTTIQGFEERSNVDVSRTMTDLLTAFRAFEANQKVLQAYDKSMEKAANEVGRVN